MSTPSNSDLAILSKHAYDDPIDIPEGYQELTVPITSPENPDEDTGFAAKAYFKSGENGQPGDMTLTDNQIDYGIDSFLDKYFEVPSIDLDPDPPSNIFDQPFEAGRASSQDRGWGMRNEGWIDTPWCLRKVV